MQRITLAGIVRYLTTAHLTRVRTKARARIRTTDLHVNVGQDGGVHVVNQWIIVTLSPAKMVGIVQIQGTHLAVIVHILTWVNIVKKETIVLVLHVKIKEPAKILVMDLNVPVRLNTLDKHVNNITIVYQIPAITTVPAAILEITLNVLALMDGQVHNVNRSLILVLPILVNIMQVVPHQETDTLVNVRLDGLD